MPKPNRRAQIKRNIGGKQRNRQRGKQPGNTPLTDPLTTPQARNMAKSQAQAEYGPVVRAAKGELRGSKARQKQIGQWFGGLEQQIGQVAQGTDASYAQANNALLAHANAAAAAAQGAQGQVAQSNSQLAQLTGADASLMAPSLAEGAAAAGQRAITNQALAAPILQAGASQAGYLRNTGLNARREGIQQRQNESKRRQKIKEDLTALRKERAQKSVGNFREIRGEERDYGIQRSAFKLDQQEAAQNAQDDAFDNRIAAKNARTSARNAATSERNAGTSEASLQQRRREDKRDRREERRNGGMTPDERRDVQEGRRNAMAAARRTVQANGVPKSAAEWAGLEAIVAKEEGVSAQEAREAVKRLRKKMSSAGVAADPNGPSLGR